jgi:hypothetical protein
MGTKRQILKKAKNKDVAMVFEYIFVTIS